MNLKNTFSDKNFFPGIYRGFVVWNDDPLVQGRIKVFVPGIYSDKYELSPNKLPWARPLSPSFGGGAPNLDNSDKHLLNDETGWCSVPHAGDVKKGAQVFLFFENGDINYPVYFGVAQSQKGWFSEHPNQHCFNSDNVRVRIDEKFEDTRSTCKFDSYNSKNSDVAKKNLERECIKNDWQFDEGSGNIKELPTRLDIEIKATGSNAVNLNIHGNVNMHIDGDWFVEHIGNKYEYQEGDVYVKQNGNTYIERNGHIREVLSGNFTRNLIGNQIETQDGDYLASRTGTSYERVGNDVSKIYDGNYKIKVGGNSDEITAHDKIVEVGNGTNFTIVNDIQLIVGGSFKMNSDSSMTFDSNENVSIHSKSGNIMIKTDGDFELTDENGVITCEGFKNLGTKGNIQLISTFGNINLQCIKNDNLAKFSDKATVIPWNPDFVRHINENPAKYRNISPVNAALSGMAFNTDINNFEDFVELMKTAQQLLIYDGLPVFLPTRMIVQNPNITSPQNENDLSWLASFGEDAKDWRTVKDDVMWKLPGRMMGNINIESWSGDINIKTESELGCAGNINLKAEEKIGTFNGYKAGTITLKNSAKKRVYSDPRNLFLDSDFEKRNGKMLQLFIHGTDELPSTGEKSPLPSCADSYVVKTGYKFEFAHKSYSDFYKTYAKEILSKGGVIENVSDDQIEKLKQLDSTNPIQVGCNRCITDYLLGIPDVQDTVYKDVNLKDVVGEIHSCGAQRLRMDEDGNAYARGTFNITTQGQNYAIFDRISLADGHAVDSGFMKKDFSSQNLGALVLDHSGDFVASTGKNKYTTIHAEDLSGLITDDYIYTETPFDFNVPNIMKSYFSNMKSRYESEIGKYIQVENTGITIEPGRGAQPFEAKFRFMDILEDPSYHECGYISVHNIQYGSPKLLSGDVQGDFLQTSTYRINRQAELDFGFDLEEAQKQMDAGSPKDISPRFTENDMFTTKIDRGSDVEIHEGGNKAVMKINHLGGGKDDLHVEVTSDFDSHDYSIEDRSRNWRKSHEGRNTGKIWWDKQGFSQDLVPNFPDVKISVKSIDTDRLLNGEVETSKTYDSWIAYGNHITGGNHANYIGPTDRCEKMFKVLKGGESMVNSASLLWENKRSAGVRTKRNTHVTANQAPKPFFKLYKIDCGKNQLIETTDVWDALTGIDQKTTKSAGRFISNVGNYSSDMNTNAFTYTAAVNKDLLVLNSDHVVLVPNEEKEGGRMMGTNEYTLQASNTISRKTYGNQEYMNYSAPSHPFAGVTKWKDSEKYSNTFELVQNDFHNNTISIKNGNNVFIPKEGTTPEFAKSINNEFVFMNGCYTPSSIESANVCYYKGKDFDAIPGLASGTPLLPLSSINNFTLMNGNDGEMHEINELRFENGLNVIDACNLVELENGAKTLTGANVVRVDNHGSLYGNDLENSITLNNDNNRTNLILSDKHSLPSGEDGTESSDWLENPIVSIYSIGTINENAVSLHKIDAGAGARKFNTLNEDVNVIIVKAHSISIDVGTISIKSEATTWGSASISIIASNAIVDAGILNVTSNISTLDSNSHSTVAGSYSLNANDSTLEIGSMNATVTDLSMNGTSISIQAKDVDVNKINATGSFTGHLNGSMNGPAMLGGYLYLMSPVQGSPVAVANGIASTAAPASPRTPSAPKAPTDNESPIPVSNLTNTATLESNSLKLSQKIKSIVNKFIDFELSLFDKMNGGK